LSQMSLPDPFPESHAGETGSFFPLLEAPLSSLVCCGARTSTSTTTRGLDELGGFINP
jgi:hypothetical protein